jgi:alpha-soluble NSF attachment protein
MSIQQGREFLKLAEGKTKSGFMSLFTGGPKYDEAAELYSKAGVQFKMARDWQQAADAFVQSAFASCKAGSPNEEAVNYLEAARCLKNLSQEQAQGWYEKAVKMYSDAGRFSQAGKILKEVGEAYESFGSMDKALIFYTKAVDVFELDEHSKTQVTSCILKKAEIMSVVAVEGATVDEEKLVQAAKLFETEGQKATMNPMLAFGAREHFLKAGLCLLALGDTVSIKVGVARFHDKDPKLETSREGGLLRGLSEAFAEGDVDAFRDKLDEYDSVSRLDGWKTKLLLIAVKKLTVGGAAENLEGGVVDLS